MFEKTVTRCIEEGLASGQRMAVDASLIEADANKQNSTPKEEWDASTIDIADAPRAVREYLNTLDEAAFGAASEVQPKFTSHSDPASQWTAARKGPAFFSYSDNYLIDTDHGVILDVEGTRSIRQAEVGSTETMLTRVKDKFDLVPDWMIADTAYGSGPMLGWLVDRKIDPYIPVIDKAGRPDGTWTRTDFEWEAEKDQYICPEGHALKQFRRNYSDPNRGPTGKGTARYRALKEVCQICPSKPKCCPNADARKITREEHEDARQVARDLAKTEEYQIAMKLRKKVEMLFAHLKRILGLGRLRLRGPCGANDEFLLAATRSKSPQTGQDPSCTAANAQSLIGKALELWSEPHFLRQQHVVFPQNPDTADLRCDCVTSAQVTNSAVRHPQLVNSPRPGENVAFSQVQRRGDLLIADETTTKTAT